MRGNMRKQGWLPGLGRKRGMGKGRKKEFIFFNYMESFGFLFFRKDPRDSDLFDYGDRPWSE
jgi:hypothetical protein